MSLPPGIAPEDVRIPRRYLVAYRNGDEVARVEMREVGLPGRSPYMAETIEDVTIPAGSTLAVKLETDRESSAP